MMEEELIKIWQSSSNQERIKFEKSRLMLNLQTSLDEIHKKIQYRDLREYIAIGIVIPVFAYYAYSVPNLLSKVASFLIIGYALFVALKLRNAKKYKPSAFTETYLEYLHKSKEYLLHQKQLLDSVIYWYILPGIILTMLFALGLGVTDRLKPILKVAIANVVIAISIYYLNKQAVRKELVPRLSKIDELIRLMENPS
jgi:large-conductance mechanosensitive channel